MGAAVAVVNITTALLQVISWRKMASRICLSLNRANHAALKRKTKYCFLLVIWAVGMVCISGLDVTIVGHYAYDQTAFYSIATLPTNFMILIIAAILGPLMPASSALSTQRSATEMGDILTRTMRYSTILLLLTGLPFLVYGFPILRLWVGPVYAVQSLKYLRILVLANIVRNLCAPYATIVVAIGRLKAATAAPVLEATVNLGSSIYLVHQFGAIGVAYGTMLGAIASVSLHFLVSMHLTRNSLLISRPRLILSGFFRPAAVVIPSLLILPLWWSSFTRMTFEPVLVALWTLSTLLLAWFGTLNREERSKLVQFTRYAPCSHSPQINEFMSA